MDFELHAPDGTELLGYRLCKCGVQVIAEVWQALGGRCQGCYSQGEARRVRVIEVVHRGRAAKLKIPGSAKSPNRGSKGNRHTAQVRKHAERAALKRLRAIYPDIYRMLYNEERLARGLLVVGASESDALTGDPSAFYAALTSAGVDIASYTNP